MSRRKTRIVEVGSLKLGGSHPVLLQSMTNTDTRDATSTLAQINRLVDAGCDLVRVAVPDKEALESFATLSVKAPCPLVADVHFDYRLAVGAIEAGAAKVRINPGNIGSWDRVQAVIKAAREYGAAIRIGVNAGSLPKEVLHRYKHPTAAALVEAGMAYLHLLQEEGFEQLVFSFKSSSVVTTIEAYQLAAEAMDWPLHIGVTEAGTAWRGTIHSCVGIGSLLSRGIGDTLRVSLTADPVEEAKVGLEILRALNLRPPGISIISCPTCARTPADLISLAEDFEKRVAGLSGQARVAIMGCAVNGPGEAREADIGIALGPAHGVLFVSGEIIDRVPVEQALDRLYEEVCRFVGRS